MLAAPLLADPQENPPSGPHLNLAASAPVRSEPERRLAEKRGSTPTLRSKVGGSSAALLLATGGGFATRKLYSDDELYVFNFSRPVVINGIADFVNRPDLLERSIALRLPNFQEGQRKTEQAMLGNFQVILPGILASLYDIASKALANPL